MQIITDSTADLRKEEYENNGIRFVPLTIHLGEKSWRDFYDIEPDEYYSMLRSTRAFPSTSQPSTQDFADVFAPFVAAGEPVLSIHISSKLSGTYQSALLARSQFSGATIEVLDSLQASLGLGLILMLCAERMASGADFEEVVALARKLAGTVDTYFSVDSLEYLQRGGRIGKAQALLGTLMRVKPLLKLSGGEVQPLEKIRTTDRLLNRFVEIVKTAAEDSPIRLSSGESDNSDLMSGLLGRPWRTNPLNPTPGSQYQTNPLNPTPGSQYQTELVACRQPGG